MKSKAQKQLYRCAIALCFVIIVSGLFLDAIPYDDNTILGKVFEHASEAIIVVGAAALGAVFGSGRLKREGSSTGEEIPQYLKSMEVSNQEAQRETRRKLEEMLQYLKSMGASNQEAQRETRRKLEEMLSLLQFKTGRD